MKKSWYQEIYQTVDDAIKFRIPVEIVHFPSTGITSSINKLAHIYNSELQDMRFLIVDMDAARFVSDPERNRYEFFRVIRSHLEQQLNIVIEQDLIRIYIMCWKRSSKNLFLLKLEFLLFLRQRPDYDWKTFPSSGIY